MLGKSGRFIGFLSLILIVLSVAVLPLCAGTIYVKTTGSDSNSGVSWTLAKQTVQAGIDAAHSGDDVWVAKGTYLERVILKSGVEIYGGFAGGETTLSQRPAFPRPESDPNETVLDGSNAGTVVTIPSGTSETAVDGFTITHGICERRDNGLDMGGGVYAENALSRIANNLIEYNSCGMMGGGITCSGGSPTIKNNIIRNSQSSGIYVSGAGGTISGNTITNNGESGIYCKAANGVVITDNVITSNWGSGVFCRYGSASISDNDISENSAYDGGGIYCDRSTATITGNKISENSAASGLGGGICK